MKTNETSLDTLCGALSYALGIEPPKESAAPCKDLTDYIDEVFKGEKADRVFMYNPDAIAEWIYEKYPQLFKKVKENADIEKFLAYAKWLRRVSAGKLSRHAIDYALFEILAEYKRRGITKMQLLKAMLMFGLPFLLKEIPARKKRARTDGIRCIQSAAGIGYKHTGGTLEFPTFSK